MAMKAGKTPPIDVYQVGESYFVLDGNHRVSIARQHGLETIEAYVWEFPTPHGLSPEADIDELLIKSEQVEFLEKIGQASPPAVREIVFTCPDCYGDLMDMIETYRQGLEEADENPGLMLDKGQPKRMFSCKIGNRTRPNQSNRRTLQ